jgi:hypothetical protein
MSDLYLIFEIKYNKNEPTTNKYQKIYYSYQKSQYDETTKQLTINYYHVFDVVDVCLQESKINELCIGVNESTNENSSSSLSENDYILLIEYPKGSKISMQLVEADVYITKTPIKNDTTTGIINTIITDGKQRIKLSEIDQNINSIIDQIPPLLLKNDSQ